VRRRGPETRGVLLGKRWGFSRSGRKAPVFYFLVAVGTIGGTLLSLTSTNPIQLLVVMATVNGIAAAPFPAVGHGDRRGPHPEAAGEEAADRRRLARRQHDRLCHSSGTWTPVCWFPRRARDATEAS
jgi:hypothetical protein